MEEKEKEEMTKDSKEERTSAQEEAAKTGPGKKDEASEKPVEQEKNKADSAPVDEAGKGKSKKRDKTQKKKRKASKRYNIFHRVFHFLITLGVVGACVTGFPLKLKDWPGMADFVKQLGGVTQMAFYHRIFAGMIGAYIVSQIFYVLYYFIALRRGVDVSSLSWVLPRKRQTLDVKANTLYLMGRGKEPSFKKQVYWGVFDWVVMIASIWAIIVSGAMVWWPEIVARYIPGTWLNAAYVTHSNGALLFIVVVLVTHFYNIYWSTGHISDCNVIFTGRMTTRRKKLT